MRKIITLCLVIAVTVFFGTAIAQANVNIDFGGWGSLADTFAGGADQAGYWNNTGHWTGGSPYSGDLLDLNGNATDASYEITGAYGTNDYAYGVSYPVEEYLVDDFFYSFTGESGKDQWSVTISGLDDGVYDIYYYAPTYSGVDTGEFTVNGAAMANLNGNSWAGGPFVQGTSYDIAQQITVTGGELTLTQTSASTYGHGLAGMQIVAVAPEPVSSVLFVVGGTVLGFRKRFFKKKEVFAAV
jgi:hypothetical protein